MSKIKANRNSYKMLCTIILSFILIQPTYGQAIGSWQSYFNYSDIQEVVEADDVIYCASSKGIFAYDIEDNSVKTYSRIDGFSQTDIKTMGWSAGQKALVVAYQNGNIDVLKNGKVTNVNAFINSTLPGTKEISSLSFNENFCYISTSIGVLVLDLNTLLFGDSYLNINPKDCKQIPYTSTVVSGNVLFAASGNGVISAPLGSKFLRDCKSWTNIYGKDSCLALANFQNTVFAIFSTPSGIARYELRRFTGTSWTLVESSNSKFTRLHPDGDELFMVNKQKIYVIDKSFAVDTIESKNHNDVVRGTDNKLYIGVDFYGLVVKSATDNQFLKPSGPSNSNIVNLYTYKSNLWITSGLTTDQGAAAFTADGISLKWANGWINYNSGSNGFPDFRDYMQVRYDTVNNHIWITSLFRGIIELDPDGKVLNVFSDSTLPIAPNKVSAFAGLGFDKNNNMWVAGYRNPFPLWVKTAGNKWYRFIFPNTDKNEFTKILFDRNNNVWLQSPREGLIAYNHNNTIPNPADDRYKIIGTGPDEGNLHTPSLNDIAIDRNGQLWLGTNDGPTVLADPTLTFSNFKWEANRPYIKSGKDSGYLLSGQVINCITVDGANRKWFGTKTGAWLTSADGDKIIQNFNINNSPLPGNDIKQIAINPENGIIYFATDRGLVSYTGTAIEGGAENGVIEIFPNPVKPDYYGPIAIKTVVRDATVKITDITGKIVYETIAEGGQAIWYGNDFSGRRANTGVYLVHISDNFGSKTTTSKIVFIR